MLVVYFSSTTENTHRFVQKLGFPSARIPLRRTDEPLVVNEPYV
ncbi:class Ib ribonucleoside-diphosphate reductase assembly flavoprotein NrdI, partial [Salmonella enterica]